MVGSGPKKVLLPKWREVLSIIPKGSDLVFNGVALHFYNGQNSLKNIHFVLVGPFLMKPSWAHSNPSRFVLRSTPAFLSYLAHQCILSPAVM